ncbi:hypothetical protein M758_UG193200 [Ceratodon purpureus]|nr:hypothetical protein M758_UG193200 [Ceratodon purpureus]
MRFLDEMGLGLGLFLEWSLNAWLGFPGGLMELFMVAEHLVYACFMRLDVDVMRLMRLEGWWLRW